MTQGTQGAEGFSAARPGNRARDARSGCWRPRAEESGGGPGRGRLRAGLGRGRGPTGPSRSMRLPDKQQEPGKHRLHGLTGEGERRGAGMEFKLEDAV